MKTLWLFLLLLVLVSHSVSAQLVQVVNASIPGTVVARTMCNLSGQFRIEVDTTKENGKDPLTLVHELHHVGQMVGLGCAAAESLYTSSPDFALRAELDAYCSEARQQVLMNLPVTNPVPMFRMPFDTYLFLAYGLSDSLDLDSTRAVIASRCPDLVGK